MDVTAFGPSLAMSPFPAQHRMRSTGIQQISLLRMVSRQLQEGDMCQSVLMLIVYFNLSNFFLVLQKRCTPAVMPFQHLKWQKAACGWPGVFAGWMKNYMNT